MFTQLNAISAATRPMGSFRMKFRPMILGVIVATLLLFAIGAATGGGGGAANTQTGVIQTLWSDIDLH